MTGEKLHVLDSVVITRYAELMQDQDQREAGAQAPPGEVPAAIGLEAGLEGVRRESGAEVHT